MFNIEEELKKLPAQPGVYLMHDAKDEIIYVGKAVSLKNRVRQYFQSSRNKTAKIEQMVSRIARFEYIITDSELEALVLECNLIKEYRPRYNTMLKDDKTYPYIKVTVGEAVPQGAVFPPDEKGQEPVLRPLHQRRGGEGYHRADPQAVQDPHLQPFPAQGHRQRAALPQLPHQTVRRPLPGLYQPGGIPGADRHRCWSF